MKFLNKITSFSSSKKGSKIVLIGWLLIVVLLAALAPSAKDYEVNVSGSDLPNNAASMIAEKKLNHYFKEVGGTPALFVFTNKDGISTENKQEIGELINSLLDKDNYPSVKEVLPFQMLPPQAQDSLLSEDKTTLSIPVILKEDLEMKEINKAIKSFTKAGDKALSGDVELYITGPAGIASDTLELFSNADLVLLFSTIGIILILLMIIYRSPLLALIPLIIAGVVQQVVDRVLGIAGKAGFFEFDSQSMSIMMILLFAALTDYSLFVFSRYREELKVNEDKFTSMKKAMQGVGEPIFFSAGTVLAAMLILFTAVYKPYQNFAPTFSTAMVIILLAGITLIPATFSLCGRRAFWPSIPRVVGVEDQKSETIWSRIAEKVTRKPFVSGGIVLILLGVSAINMSQINYSFNLIKSFPDEMQSRKGFDLLEEKFSQGDLAPTDVLIVAKEKGDITKERIEAIQKELVGQTGVEKVSVSNDQRGKPVVAESDPYKDKEVVKLSLTFKENPYEQKTMDALLKLRDHDERILEASGFDETNTDLYFGGETAKQTDVRALNSRDTILVVSLIVVLIFVLLMIQTRAIVAPIYMIATILLSYSSSMGISYFIFEKFCHFDSMSYRIPLYAFVFLVALGVDYNIMLMSRVQEELKEHGNLKRAVQQGVAKTGGVISSAGLILAATFAVLITQPIMELFMFGFVVAIGILIDTFLVRGVLVPAIILKLGKWNFWPRRI